jgi:hypothetical protein
MKNIQTLLLTLCLLMAGIEFSSCSSDTVNTDTWGSGVAAMFQNMKGNYSCYLDMPDNTRKSLNIAISDVTKNSYGTAVQVVDFPIDVILSKLYPNDYQYVSSVNVDTYESPIDSVGASSSAFLLFKTNNDYTENLNFSFVRDGVSHQGWAKVSVQGVYTYTNNNMTFYFSVNDLVLDDQDKSNLTPILFQAEGTKTSSTK